MNSYEEWRAAFPQAAAALEQMHGACPWPVTPPGGDGKSEAWAQQQVRLTVAHAGALAWRNNNGATPSKCPDCGAPQAVVRYGLANDSAQLNEKMKSSDLILCIPRVIQPQDVGRTIGQFGSIEAKRPGWVYTGKGREVGQMNWLSLVASKGGLAMFSTGAVKL